ncbi:MAG: single-stranded-DNA-specific exonuclease RecJ [Acidiferrobacterales bacterium]|nr:single-stranded-DNA-specific exonuclease RecJ [Acidiferrobacterales bacterium]
MSAPNSASKKKVVERVPVRETPLEGIHPVLDRVYRNRGVKDPKELDYSLTNLLHPAGLANLDDAVQIIFDAVQADALILIAGDYDADGATSCALAYLALKAFGARCVSYACPDRVRFGYGLSEKFVNYLSTTQPDVLITVDNGISSIAGVKLAKEYGITVVVTDHHLPGDSLPEADAIVNPRLPKDQFESKNLAGVGVIFYVLSTLKTRLAEANWFADEGIKVPVMADYLDLVALGTIADVVPLDRNNRILVAQGLRRINSENCRVGIRGLLESDRRTIGKISSEDLAFSAGPRLNAAGRLDDIRYGVKCLTSNDRSEVFGLLEKIENFNQRRRDQEHKMATQAMSQVERLENNLDVSKYSNCLVNQDWHSGIVGLIASRVREHTGRPTIVFAPDNDGNLRGSGRSVWNVNIRDAIADVSNLNPQLVVQFGGHAMAAGLTIAEESFEEFSDRFEDVIARYQEHQPAEDRILTDGEIESLDLDTAEAIRNGGPWGQAFETPLFDGRFEIVQYAVVKEIHLKMTVRSLKHSKTVDAIFFRYFQTHHQPPDLSTYTMIYRLEVNEFRGRKKPQLIVQQLSQ